MFFRQLFQFILKGGEGGGTLLICLSALFLDSMYYLAGIFELSV